MRTSLIVIMLLSLGFTAVGQVKEVTMHGEIVDVIAFVSSGAKQDAATIRASATSGNPLGFHETSTGKLYLLGSPEMNKSANEMVQSYVGLRVFVKGKTYNRDGTDVVLITDIGKSIR